MSRWLGGGLIAVAVYAITLDRGPRPAATTPESAGSLASSTGPAPGSPPAPPAAGWKAGSDLDELSGRRSDRTSLLSRNTEELHWPHHGGASATLVARNHPRFGKDLIFTVSKGQIVCHQPECTIDWRVDDKPARRVAASIPTDYSADTLFLRGYKQLTEDLAGSKRLAVSVNLYKDGAPVWIFDTAGFSAP